MFIVCAVVTVFIALVTFTSAMGMLQGAPQLEQILASVGFGGRMRTLGLLQLAGSIGLIVGLFWPPIGIAAATGLFIYYVGAMAVHAKAGHSRQQMFVPFPLAVFSFAALVLRIVTM